MIAATDTKEPANEKPSEKSTGPKKKNTKKTVSKKSAARKKTAKSSTEKPARKASQSDYPRHSLGKSLRIPRAILDQNAGRPCGEKEAAGFSGVGLHGPFRLELSSSTKYGLLDRPTPGNVGLSELARSILRPKSPDAEIEGLRKAFLNAPVFSDVYQHFRGEFLPDEPFFSNNLADTFKIPQDKLAEFKSLFLDSLRDARLIEEKDDKFRLIDVSQGEGIPLDSLGNIQRLSKSANVQEGDTCFVMMPFADPIGAYFKKIYEPAIHKAGLRPVRADNDMFKTGKIMDQIWSGIHAAKVLVAELTGRNPNVFYELGLAHALKKPVVLVASNKEDVPFDVQHIRVIYYDMQDPFWGDKLISKISENVLSAISNPDEAIITTLV